MTPGGADAVREQLVERERLLLAPRAATDVGALVAVDFLEVGASGRRWDRTSILALVEGRRGTTTAAEFSEVGCRHLGGDAHLLTFTLRSESGTTRRASVWDLIDGRWQMVYHHGTPVPE